MNERPPFQGSRRTTFRKKGAATTSERAIPAETPIAFTYERDTFAVMMASPTDLEDFAIGFSLSEGIVASPAEIDALEIIALPTGIELRMSLTEARRDALELRRRRIAGPASCGLCGLESIEEATAALPVIASQRAVDPATIFAAVAMLKEHQPMNAATRAVHAAGFFGIEAKKFALVREDVGRHNALDKLIGGLARQACSLDDGLVVMTSRVSIELVQKVARAGCPILVAVSAPTTFAVEAARNANVTLIAVARDDSFEVFAYGERIIEGHFANVP